MEAELFGHEKGAFTDAKQMKKGLFEMADGGTLFLDEIGELSPLLQAKLLRVLEDQVIRRVGGVRDMQVDVRVIAASNRDLEKAVREAQFRQDLYYRLAIIAIFIPPLRDRKNDIPLLIEHFLRAANARHARHVTGMAKDTLDACVAYDWPGNIRELENCIERAAILCNNSRIEAADLQLGAETASSRLGDVLDLSGTLADATERAMKSVEKAKIVEALTRTASRNEAAELLGIAPRTLTAKMKDFGLE